MPRSAVLLAIMLLMWPHRPAGAENWPQFRGPGGQGHSSATNLPSHWSPTENVTWKVSIPGLGWSSPVHWNGRIYLTTAVPRGPEGSNDQSLRALCLDAASGDVLWNVEVFQQDGEQTERIHSKNSHASPTPVTDGTHVFVHYGTQGTACLTLAGDVVWTNRELRYLPQHGNGGSPILVDDLLVVCCDGSDTAFVAALDQRTGRIQWKTDRNIASRSKFSFSTPLAIEVEGRRQIICPGTNAVSAYAPDDGRVLWTVDYPGGYSVIPRPVFGHGLVYVCTGYGKPSLFAIRPTGTGNVTDSRLVWKTDRNAPHTPSVLLVGDELYMVSDRGIASCLDAKTGRVHWQQRLEGKFSASPLFADGKIYLQAEEGETIVIKPGKEFVELARNQLEPRTFASFAVADSALFIRTEEFLYRIEK